MAGKKKAKMGEVEEPRPTESIAVAPDNVGEKIACNPVPVKRDMFNEAAVIPYGCTIEHIYQAMNEFLSFLGFINAQLNTKGIQRFESMLMPANFSKHGRGVPDCHHPQVLPDTREEPVSQRTPRPAPEREDPRRFRSAWDRRHRNQGVPIQQRLAGAQRRRMLANGCRLREQSAC